MIIPDINLLLYAYDSSSTFHAKAASWWESCLSGTEDVGLAQAVIFGFVRIVTNGRVFRHPLTAAEAAAHVRSWLDRPVVQIMNTEPDHVHEVLSFLESLGTAGNLVTDAQIAVIAIDHDAVLHTSDADFVRFPKLRWFNPISDTGSRSLRRGI